MKVAEMKQNKPTQYLLLQTSHMKWKWLIKKRKIYFLLAEVKGTNSEKAEKVKNERRK
jgi:hypothetical protein